MTIHQKVCVELRNQADEILHDAKDLNFKIHNIWTNEEVVFEEEADRSYIESNQVKQTISMLKDDIEKLQMLLRLLEK